MRISEFEGEKALDVLADILEPFGEILSDENVRQAWKDGKKMRAIAAAIKGHKSEVIYIMAALDDTPVEEYKVNLLTLPFKILEILNDPEVVKVFNSQPRKKGEVFSMTAMDITTEDDL